MNKTSYYITLSLIFLNILCVSAQNGKSAKQNFFESMSKTDSASGASVKFFQDKRIENFVVEKRYYSGAQLTTTGNGYRVQVFSSNVQRTAKSEAFKIEKEILDLFPEYPVYVNYTSPFWKVRVGNFSSYSEAQSFREELVKYFPHLKSETYTVKDQINIPVSK